MNRVVLAAGALAALGLCGAARAQSADQYLIQANLLPHEIDFDTYKNSALLQHFPVPGNVSSGNYGLWGGGLTGSFDVKLNVLTTGHVLEDTIEVAGTSGMGIFSYDVLSGGPAIPLTPLAGGTNVVATGSWQNITQFLSYNGDSYTLQFMAPAPEPAAWTMLILGFGLLGLAARRRARSAMA